MKIKFGLHLDGQRSWQRCNQLGQATVGPLAFLRLLETFLGLPSPTSTEGERILQYRALLEEQNSASNFYARSFQADQYAVARTLLSWRDTWYLNGWNGSFASDAPSRLRDLASIELHTSGRLVQGVGERLKLIAIALDQRKHPIESVELVDMISDFPYMWREVLNKLTITQIKTDTPLPNNSNLYRLQQALINPTTNQITWASSDDSVIILRSHSRLTAASFLSELCNIHPSETLLIAENEGALYDTISSANGNAQLGISEKSELRPALQLLTIAFAMIWKPLDVHALLEFLAHPMNPLPPFASRLLADAVSSQPGIGGQKWITAIEKIKAIAGSNAEDVMETITQWIKLPSIQADESAPTELILDIATRVASSFRMRLGNKDELSQHAQYAGNAQCAQAVKTLSLLKKQGIKNISKLDLDKLLEQTVFNSETNPARGAEVGCCLLATHPSAAIESQDSVIWWNLAAPNQMRSYPWHKNEMAALITAGVKLPQIEDLMDSDARNWLRPILAARKQLILSLPTEGEEVHPIWLSIERLLKKDAIHIQFAEDVLSNALKNVATTPILHTPLPHLRRWWNVEKGLISPRKDSSFTSLDKYINNPFEWVISYAAGIKLPNILTLSSGNKLLGSLAHRAIELLHSEKDALKWSPEQAVKWVEGRFQRLLEEEGAVLLMSGQRAKQEAFRIKLLSAVSALQKQLQSAKIETIESEKNITGSFFMGNLTGSIDIFATRKDGQSAVVDMKWSRGNDFREKLQNNKHVQLAIYASAIQQETGKWAVPAYFILDSGTLFAHDKTFFTEASVAKAKQEEGSALLWQQTLETLRWRETQIKEGNIELIFKETEADAESVAPVGALEVDASKWQNDYRRLAGWGAEA